MDSNDSGHKNNSHNRQSEQEQSQRPQPPQQPRQPSPPASHERQRPARGVAPRADGQLRDAVGAEEEEEEKKEQEEVVTKLRAGAPAPAPDAARRRRRKSRTGAEEEDTTIPLGVLLGQLGKGVAHQGGRALRGLGRWGRGVGGKVNGLLHRNDAGSAAARAGGRGG